MILSVVWSYWIAVALTALAVVVVLAVVVGYVVKVSGPRYPRR